MDRGWGSTWTKVGVWVLVGGGEGAAGCALAAACRSACCCCRWLPLAWPGSGPPPICPSWIRCPTADHRGVAVRRAVHVEPHCAQSAEEPILLIGGASFSCCCTPRFDALPLCNISASRPRREAGGHRELPLTSPACGHALRSRCHVQYTGDRFATTAHKVVCMPSRGTCQPGGSSSTHTAEGLGWQTAPGEEAAAPGRSVHGTLCAGASWTARRCMGAFGAVHFILCFVACSPIARRQHQSLLQPIGGCWAQAGLRPARRTALAGTLKPGRPAVALRAPGLCRRTAP